ncbi:proton-translocating NADH-quinone oxidoreductase, chain M [Saccharomonospora marina XMU15]|uniref:Proton-translocating NADH-quinone oxidoreductase, chain M n=1 Tax=Saccharomonospora marina XMU15 TaxID=882083 RepID=H5X7K2_9PSEU|nr:NADH-quinone oxidoreductase subunit M [Saccharomonospora marina]EHR50222.1 proton-translocating NADH-quinone oxidoreductase, chain M [Saccharomonospora marina XMU15]
MAFPWLTTVGALPLIGSGVLALLPRGADRLARRVAFTFALAAMVVLAVATTGFRVGESGLQLAEHHDWIPHFGISYGLGVDGVGLTLVALTTVLTPIVIAASANAGSGFLALALALETTAIGAFAATDVFLFYVLFEAMLVPMYFLIGRYGGRSRSAAAMKFLLYSLAGGLLMLVAVIGLYVVSAQQLPQGTFDFPTLAAAVRDGTLRLDPVTERLLFAGFFVAFAIKAPLWPLHSWLPSAVAESTPGTAVLLVGILDKVGTFGMLRYCLSLFPDASEFFTPLVVVLSVIGIGYGALVAIGQNRIMRLIAYTSLSHFGFITIGVFAMTPQSQAGAAFYMVSHGLSVAALFLIAGFLISRRGSDLIADYGGVQQLAPVLAGTFLFAGLATLALPGLSGFVAEFLVLVGTFTAYPAAAVIAAGGVVLAAVYVLWLYQRTMTGDLRPGNEGVTDLATAERWVIAPLLALILGLGLYPQPVLDVIEPVGEGTVQQTGVATPRDRISPEAR